MICSSPTRTANRTAAARPVGARDWYPPVFIVALAFAFTWPNGIAAADDTFVPDNPDVILLESLPPEALITATVDTPSQRRDAVAQRIRQFQQDGDPRWISEAGAVLMPLLATRTPDSETLALAAYLDQANHDFDAALNKLQRVVEAQPAHAGAWQMLADIERVRGRLDAAHTACAQRFKIAPDPIGLFCLAEVAGLQGDFERADAWGREAIVQASGAPQALAWMYAGFAGFAERQGNVTTALQNYHRAVQYPESQLFVRLDYARALIREARGEEALVVLRGAGSGLTATVLRARAEALATTETDGHSARLARELLDLETRRGQLLHDRERAEYFLFVELDAEQALIAAQRNFVHQREPTDLLIYLEAAQRVDSESDIAAVRSFVEASGLYDRRIERLLQ